MKKELSKIAQDLEKDIITESEARTLLLGLLGVGGSTVDVNEISKGDKFIRTTTDKPSIGNPKTTKGKIYEVIKISSNERFIRGLSIGMRVDDRSLRWYSARKFSVNYKRADV